MNTFGLGESSFDIDTYDIGLSVDLPKITADFVAGTYKASGQTKNFADLFTFNRAGKAWLVKDTGLVEYAVDVPRFDNGLLIEQVATNRVVNTNPSSYVSSNTLVTQFSDTIFGIHAYKLAAKTDGNIELSYSFGSVAAGEEAGIYIKKSSAPLKLLLSGFSGGNPAVSLVFDNKTGAILTPSPAFIASSYGIKSVGNDWWYVYLIRSASSTYRYLSVSSEKDVVVGAGESITIALPQQLVSSQNAGTKSPIVTSGSPVTRPADFIASKITTGTALTGDWDSTLNLSLVNGQLSWTGYGRIRTLEIT